MTTDTPHIDWIAVDWGTSKLRAWAMSGDEVVERRSSDDGMGKLSRDAFEPALRKLCDGWPIDTNPIVACGMVGSRQGWVEARYSEVPTPPLNQPFAQPDTGLDAHVIPGLSQSDPADVMRGEETQIAGLLARQPNFDGVICLPGTHTKWVHISAGEAVSFRTFMTGELFALISKQSVLRHSMAEDGWGQAAFDEAVADAMSKPEDMARRLFNIRAETLLLGLAAGPARARLSGLLIGMELAGARPYWLGQEIAIVGAQTLSAHYEAALALQGATATIHDATEITLAGLSAARDKLKEPAT